ncbi:hypothetical protein [Ornithinimicrobium kibberense]|uniref:hypothetical protein n=1 Tax=Ornithinimicrobium kibberense TaxID=282060 RepID=UPI003612407B
MALGGARGGRASGMSSGRWAPAAGCGPGRGHESSTELSPPGEPRPVPARCPPSDPPGEPRPVDDRDHQTRTLGRIGPCCPDQPSPAVSTGSSRGPRRWPRG